VLSELTLTNGIFQSGNPTIEDPIAPTELITLGASATVTGGSAANHVDGVIRKIAIATTGNFTFPIGDNGFYASVTISNPNSVTNWTVQYKNETPPRDNNLESSLPGDISDVEYWVVDGSGTATVGVRYSIQSGVTNASGLVLARLSNVTGANNTFDDEQWQRVEFNNSSTDPNDGVLTTTTAQSFSTNLFTLGEQTIGALPVEMIYFNGVAEEGSVQLTWATATEINNDYFPVQKSVDFVEFEVIGKVGGNGTTNERQEYSFEDRNPFAGINYYRLQQVDFDGAFEYSEIIVVQVEQLNDGPISVNLYPNPVINNEVNLSVSGLSGEAVIHISIKDMAGKQLYNDVIVTGNGYV
jgi:hypothetical protein